MRFGREIRRRRKALGLTQDALAERARISPHFVSAIENGHTRDPSLSTLQALARGLATSVGDLVDSAREVPGLSPLGAEVGRMFDAMPEDAQTAIVTILRSLRRRPR